MTGPDQELIGNRYRLIKPLGSGGMGSVWRARDELLDREVALKELITQRSDMEPLARRRDRAVNEAQMLARVEHPAIVSVHDLIWVGDDPWIVMGYFRGRPFDDMIREDPPMDVQEVASVALPVLHGLVAAHGKGVVHRDVKPANILVAGDGSVCLVDFGIAKAVSQHTTSGQVLGTLEYLAPERLEGRSAGTAKTDLWSFGVTLYHALERNTPFHAETPEATMAAILGREPHRPRRCGMLTEIVLQLLHKDPVKRPDAAAVAAVLKRALRGAARAQRGPRAGPRAVPRPGTPVPPRPGPAARPRPVPGPVPGPGPGGHRLSHMPIPDVAAIVSGSATRSGVATLLAMPDRDAARVLDRCDYGVAGALLDGIAAEQPGRAGKILQIVAADRAGRVFDYMSQRAAARTLPALLPGEAARILRECEVRTAANALAAMDPASAGLLVRAMDRERAAGVLGHAAPAAVADILGAVPAELRRDLLNRLPAQFSMLVRRLM